MKVLLSFLVLMGMVACSGSKSTNEAEQSADGQVEEDFGDDFAEDFSEDGGEDMAAGDDLGGDDLGGDDFLSESSDDDFLVGDGSDEVGGALDGGQVETQPIQIDQTASEPMMGNPGEMAEHVVNPNETLMLIAFKIYGDYNKWKDLASWNQGKLGPNNSIKAGMRVSYQVPAQAFQWNPNGNPYLIKSGDTLGTISRDTYGSMGYWRNIWDNNRPMIKDPNKIYAGFTLYTPIIEGRGVANSNI